MGSEGKGRGKLASDREGSVTCHMGTQFCFRVYLSIKSWVVTVGIRASAFRFCRLTYDGVLLTLSIRVVPAWVSFGITTYLGLRHQHVLGALSGPRRPDFRSYGSACCTCLGTCQRLGEGKGRGKLASDREGSVTCHMGTQFCFRVYVSVF
ncbi:uncharacterized protein E6C27_scaffold174G00110 [Cucumis melo var. makuwa]|uniref:Uncharacterized protein n=1 Tax=Cucumis melo var. makuwa TaxID=1194695 RepID=A0A5A7U6W1_CUCMM|nr:uncharacterized protein E6C27_scaffold174G00110 [Cucumis melo var. makuwa]